MRSLPVPDRRLFSLTSMPTNLVEIRADLPNIPVRRGMLSCPWAFRGGGPPEPDLWDFCGDAEPCGQPWLRRRRHPSAELEEIGFTPHRSYPRRHLTRAAWLSPLSSVT